MLSYKILDKQIFSDGDYKIVPIRLQDRHNIRKWRNEQLYHLRQKVKISAEDQDKYFKEIVFPLFLEEHPEQILFSYLKSGICIGYGGLVHINWIDKNAEISFAMKTDLEKVEFEFHWIKFLGLIEEVAREVKLHKIFTYAFDLRPHLYSVLEKAGFYKEAILEEHCYFQNDFIDVIIHSKILNKKLTYRKATIDDAKILYDWVNESEVRKNSLSNDLIDWQNHLEWLIKKLNDENTFIFIFSLNNRSIGQVRIDFKFNSWIIDYSLGKLYRGKGLGTEMLRQIIKLEEFRNFSALVKNNNISSVRVFKKLGFEEVSIKDKGNSNVLKFRFSKE